MGLGNTILTALEFPQEIVANVPKITIVGRDLVCVENYLSLVEYKKENIKLKFSDGVIDIFGKNFEIRAIGEGNIVISGKIESVRFI